MKITVLMENDTIDSAYKHAHGLSLYIEWKDRKILFDLGPNKHFFTNAKRLGVDIGAVDTVIISHGHYDHGLGLKTFLKKNKKAKIYLSSQAFGKQLKKIVKVYVPIGIKKPIHTQNLVLLESDQVLEEGCKIYTHVKYIERPIGDHSLYVKYGKDYRLDEFHHEIYLVLEEGDRRVLFSGCSHKGIEHIVKHIETVDKKPITDVIGGFHLMHYDPESAQEKVYLRDLSQQLTEDRSTHYFSCHCTGQIAYDEMKRYMGEQLSRIKTGSVIDIL